MRWNIAAIVVGLFLGNAFTWGDVVVTLRAADEAGAPITGPVPAGTIAEIEVLVSASGADDPTANVRDFLFDFAGTDPAIELTAIVWLLDPVAYPVQFNTLPAPSAATVSLQPIPALLTLTAEPVAVARVTAQVNGSGSVDAISGSEDGSGGGAFLTVGFDQPRQFSTAEGSITGGTLALTVDSGTGGDPDDRDGDGVQDDLDAFPDDPTETTDTDGDGTGDNSDPDDDGDDVDDGQDDFPHDPDETTDTDGDGVGDNTDAFPADPGETTDSDGDGIGDNSDTDGDGPRMPRMCGLGLIGPGLFLLAVLGVTRFQRSLPGRRHESRQALGA